MDEITVGAYVEVNTGHRLGERGVVQDIVFGIAHVEFDNVPGEDVEISPEKLDLV